MREGEKEWWETRGNERRVSRVGRKGYTVIRISSCRSSVWPCHQCGWSSDLGVNPYLDHSKKCLPCPRYLFRQLHRNLYETKSTVQQFNIRCCREPELGHVSEKQTTFSYYNNLFSNVNQSS